MQAQKVSAKDFQFYLPDLDNIVLVECHEDETVTVRASKNNVPDQRKISFIRKLAAEGFIPDHYQWFSGSAEGSNGVRWIKDYSWLKTHKVVSRESKRVMGRLLLGACALWLAMMRVLMVSNHPPAAARASTKTPPPALLVPGQTLAELESQHRAIADHHAAGNPPLGAAVLEEHRAENLDQH